MPTTKPRHTTLTPAQVRRALAVARRRRDAVARFQWTDLPALISAARTAGLSFVEIGARLECSRIQAFRLMKGKKGKKGKKKAKGNT